MAAMLVAYAFVFAHVYWYAGLEGGPVDLAFVAKSSAQMYAVVLLVAVILVALAAAGRAALRKITERRSSLE